MITQLSLLLCNVNDVVIDTTYDVTAFPNKNILFIFSEEMIDENDYTIIQYKLYEYIEYPQSAFLMLTG